MILGNLIALNDLIQQLMNEMSNIKKVVSQCNISVGIQVDGREEPHKERGIAQQILNLKAIY